VLAVGSLVGAQALAQPYTSRLGRFQVAERKGCAPFTVNLTILAGGCTGAQPCNMDFLGNGTQVQNQFTFTYTTPGTYTLRVFSQLNPNQDDIVITVDQNIQPNFELYSCSGRQVQLRVTDMPQFPRGRIQPRIFRMLLPAHSTCPFVAAISTRPTTAPAACKRSLR
jgi:hypothetical protein